MTKKKRLIVCCDGTWNELTSEYPTNVIKTARLIRQTAKKDNIPQIVHYLSGVGSGEISLMDRIGGGAFGWGIDQVIQDAYQFLCINYNPQYDPQRPKELPKPLEELDEIYIFGFSRGAYIARCLAGMIYNCGLVKRTEIRRIPEAYELYRNRNIKPSDDPCKDFRRDYSKQINTNKIYLDHRVPITFLGCWDTVGSLGVPDLIPCLPIDKLWNQKYAFHDAELSPIVLNAYHAVAIDEKRKTFAYSPMMKAEKSKNPGQVVEEVFFAGEHGCVGGGTEAFQGLSDCALLWMLEKAQALGLEFYGKEDKTEDSEDALIKEFRIVCNPSLKYDDKVKLFYRLVGGVKERRIADIKDYMKIHKSVKERMEDKSLNYRPKNLPEVIYDKIAE
jgi:uncharacterized protein (DUF2235 family)